MNEDDVEENFGFLGLIGIIVIMIMLLVAFFNKDNLPKLTDKPCVCECCKNSHVKPQD